MSISHESDQASRPKSESGVPVSKVTAGSPSSKKNRSQDEVRDPVEEPIDPLEPEVRHPDLVGVRESERQTVARRSGSAPR